MPTILIDGSYRFFFYSNEGFEPRHVHVKGNGGEAKLWIPSCRVSWSYNLNAAQLKQILNITKNRMVYIEEKWDEHFNR
ncbi:MAG: hypothetical protein A3J24_03140 [Deltaproteobacteria bacterium RIFCSPLOWO2_02_FULL_53_8]|nr:MAG: hypothetical protein A3J24_03140 [Deltaproteobacteria bacterium RIFCSPLOWO2_02_FULL_53_8]